MTFVPKFEHRAIPLVLLAVLVDSIGFGVVMPALPQLVTELGRIGLEEAARVSGWMLVIFAVTQFLAGPLMGQLGDRFGRRPVLVFAALAFAVDYALMSVAPTLAWLFVGRAVAGIAGAIWGPASAVIADVTPPEKRSAGFGLVGAAFGLGFILGPALGGLVAHYGPRAPFALAAVCAALSALNLLLFLPETLDQAHRRPFHLKDAHLVAAFKPLFAAGGDAAPLLTAWFFWQLAGVVYPSTWAFWAAIKLGWDARAIGLSLAYVGALSVLVQTLLTGRVIGRLGERKATVLGLGCAAFALFAYAFTTEGWQVYAFFLVGCLGALIYPALNGLLSRRVDATRQGALQGGIASLTSMAQILGPLVAAQTLAFGAERGMAGAAFLVAGALMVAALVIVALMVRPAPDAPQLTES